jgi:hypothetical protein
MDAGTGGIVESPVPIEFGGYDEVDLRAILPAATEGRRLDPPDIVFGRVKAGEVADVRIELTGIDPREVDLLSPGRCEAPGAFCAALRTDADPVDRVVVDIRYRPSVGAGMAERATLVVKDAGETLRTIPLIGRSADALPVVCSLQPEVDALGAGECTERQVRCKNLGLGPAVLTHLNLTGPFRIEDTSTEPSPTPNAPRRLDPTGVERTFRLCPVHPGPFEIDLSWGVGTHLGSDIQFDRRTISGEAFAGELTAPARVVLPVGDTEGRAQVILRNDGLGPIEVTRIDLDPPFAFAPDTRPVPRALGGGQRWMFDVVIALDALFDDRPTRGELRFHAAGRPEPLRVTLETAPLQPVRCRLRVPDDVLDLGRIRPTERLADGPPWNPQFTVGVTNDGTSPCTALVRGYGVIEGFEVLRQSFRAGSTVPPSEHTVRWAPGETIRFAATLRADGSGEEQTGHLRLSSWGPYVVDEIVEVSADLRNDSGPRIVVDLEGRPASTCGAEAQVYRVVFDGPRLDGLQIVGELSPRVELRTSEPLPASGKVVAEVELPSRPARGGMVYLRGRSEGIDFTVPLAFTGSETDVEQVDRFETSVSRGQDFVLVVDDSPSMRRWRDNLAANLLALIRWLDAQEIDYRLFVVRASAPRSPMPIGTNAVGYVQPSDPAGVRAEALTAAVGPDPTSAFSAAELEAPIDAAIDAAYALRSALRRNSPLSVVVVTDEPDMRSRRVDRAVSQLQHLKGPRNTALFSVSVVGGSSSTIADPVSGCRAGSEVVRPMPDLAALAERLGGVLPQLCHPTWNRALQNLCRGCIPRAYFGPYFLTNDPIPETLEVWIDDEPVDAECGGEPPNWTYDFATNSVRFHPWARPPPGSVLELRYRTCTP